MKTRRIVLIALAALMILSIAGIASAQQNGPRGTTPGGFGHGRGGMMGRAHPSLHIAGNVLSVVADETGLENSEIVAQLADGKTLAEVISENGGSVENVTAQLLATITERVNNAVENGNLSQERADAILANAAERVDTMLNHVCEHLSDTDRPWMRGGLL